MKNRKLKTNAFSEDVKHEAYGKVLDRLTSALGGINVIIDKIEKKDFAGDEFCTCLRNQVSENLDLMLAVLNLMDACEEEAVGMV